VLTAADSIEGYIDTIERCARALDHQLTQRPKVQRAVGNVLKDAVMKVREHVARKDAAPERPSRPPQPPPTPRLTEDDRDRCIAQRRFSTLEAAGRAAAARGNRHERVEATFCPCCSGWHLTPASPEAFTAERRAG
jgi:hypothetical protein